jgi:hypothetical protein
MMLVAPLGGNEPFDTFARRRGAALSRFSLLLVAAYLASACSGSPTDPDPRIPPTTGPPDHLQDVAWTFGSSVTTCRVEARWGDLYSTRSDVTQEATVRLQPTPQSAASAARLNLIV